MICGYHKPTLCISKFISYFQRYQVPVLPSRYSKRIPAQPTPLTRGSSRAMFASKTTTEPSPEEIVDGGSNMLKSSFVDVWEPLHMRGSPGPCLITIATVCFPVPCVGR